MGIYTTNIGSMLRRAALKYPEQPAFVSHEGEVMTYRDLEMLSNRFANGLVEMGVKKGDKVATLCLNCNEQIVAFFGTFKMGAMLVPVNVRLAAPEIVWILDHSDASVMIYTEEFKERVEEMSPRLEKMKIYLPIGKEFETEDIRYSSVLEKGGAHYPDIEVRGDDDAMILYTSGTTGRPKGAVHTHNNLLFGVVNMGHSGAFGYGDRVLQAFPLYHIAAIANLLIYIYRAGTVFLKKSFDPRDCMETIEREGITRWGAAPTVWSMIFQLPDVERYDTSSVKLVGSTGAIMPADMRKKVERIFPTGQPFDNYGMTEAGGVTSLAPPDSLRKHACVGRPAMWLELRVVDEGMNDVPVGEVGEVIFRGNSLMKEYYKDPEGTAEAMRGGWMHTGDLGRLDDEGFLYIVDRKKDMIITGAENVYPREVEEVLYTHPLIVDAAVIGVPDEKWGEAIKAVVALKNGITVTEKEIIDFCRGKIAGYKCPKSVDFMEELPKNSTGKILKRVLKDRYA